MNKSILNSISIIILGIALILNSIGDRGTKSRIDYLEKKENQNPCVVVGGGGTCCADDGPGGIIADYPPCQKK
ncbi:MAG: hypothetical protein U1E54_03425 [Candidatus Levybacteria bacterium]|nr:hypothetical protein [Candidatus Levybacteria bacterium]